MAELIEVYYNGVDLYSDGEVEDKLINHFAGRDKEVNETNDSLLYFYHVSELRKGLLYWYDFKPHSTVMEIGSGCGALTGMLCEKCERVISVELSKKRAEIVRLRNLDRDNLTIYVANINDLCDLPKVDYIVAVGVLEYQDTYCEKGNPYVEFLLKLHSMLKENGKLLLAIENRFGIKYWCGAPEDHTRIPYDGITNYRYGGKAKTFNKKELIDLLKEAGFLYNFFYYPMPDYRISEEVFSDDYLPEDEWGLGISPYYGEYMDSLMTVEKIQYKELFRNRIFDIFANSFLVEAGLTADRYCKVIYAKTNFERKKPFRTCTTILNNNKVRKVAIEKEAEQCICNCVIAANEINARESKNVSSISIRKEKNGVIMPFLTARNLLKEMLHSIELGDEKEFGVLLNSYYKALCDSSEITEKSEKYGLILKKLYIEMTPSNCFLENSRLIVYDLEKSVDNMPANFMIFRALEYFKGLKQLFAWKMSFDKFVEEYGLLNVWDEYNDYLLEYYSDITDLCNNPYKRAQIIDIDRMKLNAAFISYLGMESLHEIENLNKKLQDIIFKEDTRTASVVALLKAEEKKLKLRFKSFVSSNIGEKNEYELIPWGTGKCFGRNIGLLNRMKTIKYAIDSNPDLWNKNVGNGIKCISFDDAKKMEKNIVIVIMIDDLRTSFDIEMKIQRECGFKIFHITSILHSLEGK